MSLVCATSAQDDGELEYAQAAWHAGRPSEALELWRDLEIASGGVSPQAQARWFHWRNELLNASALEPDPQLRLRDSVALLGLFEDQGARLQAAYLYEIAISLAGECEEYAEAFSLIDAAQSFLDTGGSSGGVDAYLSRVKIMEMRLVVFRDLGLLDRAFENHESLEAERQRLIQAGAKGRQLSNLVQALGLLDVARKRWTQLAAWLAEMVEGELLEGSVLQRCTYWLAQACFEQDRDDPRGAAEAIRILNQLLGESDLDPLLRSQSHLRWARIALHRGDLAGAEEQLQLAGVAAGKVTLPSAAENAHRLVFELRLARRLGAELAEKRQALFEQWGLMLEQWRKAPLRPGGLGYLTYDNHRRILAEVLLAKLDSNDIEGAFATLHEVGAIGTLSKVLSQAGHMPGRLEAWPDELLLAYHSTREDTHLFVQRAGQDAGWLSHHWLGIGAEELESSIEDFNALIREPPRAGEFDGARRRALLERAAGLRSVLLPRQVEELLPERSKLTISGVDQLARVPFEALWSEDDGFLGLRHEIVYLPSLPLRSQLAELNSEADSFTLLGGTAEMALPAGWDLELTQHYARARSLHGAATAPGSLGREPVGVLQLFGHGERDFSRELIATIKLDQSEVGYAEIIAGAHAPALALLTACGSWRGPERAGDAGTGHLASAFFRRETPTVVLADADVSVAGTLAWSRAFHWSLSQGDSPASAAREARRELAASELYSDPFYYALLHVVGLGHQPVFPHAARRDPKTRPAPAKREPERWRWILAGAGGMLLMISLVRALRKRAA